MALLTTSVGRAAASPVSAGEAAGLLLYRNYLAYRRAWYIFVTGFLEPVLYLFSIGIGVGQLVTGFEFHGQSIPYAEFVAPGMLAASAMNGALLDSTFNFFFKLKYNKLFDQMLATPLTTMDIARGELAWSLLRGASTPPASSSSCSPWAWSPRGGPCSSCRPRCSSGSPSAASAWR